MAKFVPVDIDRGKSLKRWEIYKDALAADCYINVPVAKHHGLSRLSLGLKNSMGIIGGNRGKLHHNLGQELADLATVVAPKLTVIDATRLLLRNGPQGGRVADVKVADTVIASSDPVAADAYATTLFETLAYPANPKIPGFIIMTNTNTSEAMGNILVFYTDLIIQDRKPHDEEKKLFSDAVKDICEKHGHNIEEHRAMLTGGKLLGGNGGECGLLNFFEENNLIKIGFLLLKSQI